jgi:hypothetical protein
MPHQRDRDRDHDRDHDHDHDQGETMMRLPTPSPLASPVRRRVAASAAVAVAGLVITATTSHAASYTPPPYRLVSQCPGTLVAGWPKAVMNDSLERRGRVELRYSPENGGTNCVQLYDVAAGSHYMQVTLHRNGLSQTAHDQGTFDLYAGGLLVTGTNGRCVDITAMVDYGGIPYLGTWNDVACG